MKIFTIWIIIASAAEYNKQNMIDNPSLHTRNINNILIMLANSLLQNGFCTPLDEEETTTIHSALINYKYTISSFDKTDYEKVPDLLAILDNGCPYRRDKNVRIIIDELTSDLHSEIDYVIRVSENETANLELDDASPRDQYMTIFRNLE